MIPSPLDDATAILGARSPDVLWRYLVANTHLRAIPNTFEATVAFQTLHEHHPSGALQTAQLLCTDLRWRRVTTPLITYMEESGILDDVALDELADSFLWQDRLAWPVPRQWLRDGTVHLGRAGRKVAASNVVVERLIPPPLRRWAAARIVAHGPDRGAEVLARVEGLDARSGGAAVAGMLDAAEAWPTEERLIVIELGCCWPSGSVRLRALKLLADTDRSGAAERAMDDPSATVRRWAQRLGSRAVRVDQSAAEGAPPLRDAPVRLPDPQPSLFD